MEWAILAQIPPLELESRAFRSKNRHIVRSMWDPEAPRSWCVVRGTKTYSALIETMPGSTSTEIDLARELSKEWQTTVFALGFAGYDDPDRGVPYIARYEGGTSVSEPERPLREDPFRFAAKLGCKLRPYYDT